MLGKVNMQLAKLKHDAGESSAALKMLGEDDLSPLFEKEAGALHSLIISQEGEMLGTNAPRPENETLVERFACRVLQSTQWMVEGGLKDGAEIISRFKLIHKIAPRMEKGNNADKSRTSLLFPIEVLTHFTFLSEISKAIFSLPDTLTRSCSLGQQPS
jgi:hypothetical protein